MSAAPLLQVRDLSVQHRIQRRSVEIIQDVSFELGSGQTLGLIGESGCGKSTLARALTGLVAPAQGDIRFLGRDIAKHVRERDRLEIAKQIQMIFQDPAASLNPRLTVGRALEQPLRVHGMRDRLARANAVSDMLALVGLPPAARDRYPDEFSGGQRQRISIARALILGPKLLICDEPVAALDLSIQAQVLNLLVRLQQETQLSLLFISHDLAVVRHMADRVMVLYLGQIMEIGGPEILVDAGLHPYTHLLVDSEDHDPEQKRVRPLDTQAQASVSSRPPGCPFVARCPRRSARCDTERPALRRATDGHLVACHFAGPASAPLSSKVRTMELHDA